MLNIGGDDLAKLVIFRGLLPTSYGEFSISMKNTGKDAAELLGEIHPPSPPGFAPMTTVHPIALQRWLMASLVIRFFSSLMPSNQRTNFCNFGTKVNKIAKTVGFSGAVVHTISF